MPIKMYDVNIIRVIDNDTEVMEVLDQGVRVHRRVSISLYLNYTSSSTSVYTTQTRTYEVESIVNPGSPSRSGYTFKGWYTARDGGTKLTFPYTTPNSASVIYYAQWETAAPVTLKWEYQTSLPPKTFCFDYGGPIIGSTCSVEGDTIVVSGFNDGYSGCIRVVCRRV